MRCGALRCAAARCGVLRCAALWCGAVRCGAVRRGALPSVLTSDRWHRVIGANLLSSRSRASMRPRSASSLTRSVLLRSSRSAKATCSMASFSAPSGFSSSRCCSMCFASTRVTMPSRRQKSLTASSTKKAAEHRRGEGKPPSDPGGPRKLADEWRRLVLDPRSEYSVRLAPGRLGQSSRSRWHRARGCRPWRARRAAPAPRPGPVAPCSRYTRSSCRCPPPSGTWHSS